MKKKKKILIITKNIHLKRLLKISYLFSWKLFGKK